MTVRERIIANLKGVLEKAGFEGAMDWGHPDIGILRAYRHGSLEPLFGIHMSFNPGYVFALIVRPGETTHSAPRDRIVGKCEFGKSGGLTRLGDAVAAEARVHAPAPTPADGRLEAAYAAAVEGAGTVEIADALVELLKRQPAPLRDEAAAVLEALTAPTPSH